MIFSPANIISQLLYDFHLIFQQIPQVSRPVESLRVSSQMVSVRGSDCLLRSSFSRIRHCSLSRLNDCRGGLNVDTHLFNSSFFSLITDNDEQLGVFYHKIREGAAGGLGRGRENDTDA